MENKSSSLESMVKQHTLEKIFRNKTILITGNTGFIGTWMSMWLNLLGANVIGFSLYPPTKPSMYEILKIKKNITSILGDINNLKELQSIIKIKKPEIVFHLAAQSLVRKSYVAPLETFQSNVIGTANVLEALKNSSVKACILMTSDKCYQNNESGIAFDETRPIGGNDPYSASKGAAELVIASYRHSFFKKNNIAIASVRAGNVIGGGDWSENRLIPDCYNALNSHKAIVIRNPKAIRPWQFVLEPIYGMFQLAIHLKRNPQKFSGPWNLGPSINTKKFTVEEIVKRIVQLWGRGTVKIQHTVKDEIFSESKTLLLNSKKANRELNWKPIYSTIDALKETMNWYKCFSNGNDMNELTINQIKKYMTKLK